MQKKPKIDKKISTVTLSEEFKPVALENFGFNNWQQKKNNWIFLPCQPLKTPTKGTEKEIVLKKVSYNILKLESVNSDIDRRIWSCGFFEVD